MAKPNRTVAQAPHKTAARKRRTQTKSQPLDPNLLVGQELGAWTLTEQLGQGGMSLVYKAEHKWLPQTAAIKRMLHTHSTAAQESLKRFQQEAVTVSQLNHQNIIKVKDFGKDPTHGYFMVLEYLEGQDLSEVVKQAPLPLSWLQSLMQQICEALEVVHQNGLIHRDLKPSNIFLVPQEPTSMPHVKLLDFGVARIQSQPDEDKLTATGVMVGTPYYLAPEQIKSPQTVTAAADIYALGVILFEALTGKLPIFKQTVVEQLLAVIQQDPPKLGQYREDLAGTKLESLIQRMLSKAPGSRPASMQECWREFQDSCIELEDPYEGTVEYLSGTPSRDKALDKETRVRGSSYVETRYTTNGEEIFNVESVVPESRVKSLPTSSIPFPTPPEREETYPVRDSAPEAAQPPQTRSYPIGSTLLAFCLLTMLGVGGWLYWSHPSKNPEQQQNMQRATSNPPPAPRPEAIATWIQKGRKAFQEGNNSKAVQLWRKATKQSGWEKSLYYPKLYRAIGSAYAKMQHLYSTVHYFQLYRSAVRKEQKALKSLERQQAPPGLLQYKKLQLPALKQFRQESKNLESLRMLLSKRWKAAQKLVNLFQTQCKAKQWSKSYQTYQQLVALAPSITTHHIEVSRIIAEEFPIVGFQKNQQALEQMVFFRTQRQTLQQRQKHLEQHIQRQRHKLTQVLEKAAGFLVSKPQQGLRLLKEELSLALLFAAPTNLSLWSDWLEKQLVKNPGIANTLWSFHHKMLGALPKRRRWSWWKVTHPHQPSTEKRRQTYVSAYLKAVSYLQQAKALKKRGRLHSASRYYNRFRQTWSLLEAQSKLRLVQLFLPKAREVQSQFQTLNSMLSVQRSFLRYRKQGRYALARKKYETLRQKLKVRGKRMPAHLRRAYKQLLSAEKQLAQANQAYRSSRWRKAYRLYQSYLKKHPGLRKKKALKKRIKACQCIVEPLPWEPCRPSDLPRHYRQK